MQNIQPARGTHDLLPEDQRRFRHVVEAARSIAARYGYAEISTPIFEFTEVFARSMGETSDVVSKEMYSFNDKGGENLTLRPEYTAGICRAFISNGLTQHVPFKAFAYGPMFRFERPQKGRQRQFHQIDIEVIGAPEPEADVEVISVAADILSALGVADKCKLELNSLGDIESRTIYRKVLVDYLTAHRERLSEDSLKRLERNPLRILDSKDPGDRVIVANAPLLSESLTPAAREFFTRVCAGLEALGIAFEVNDRLVRGLDYYTHTAFEFTTTALGAQGAVIAGGRYDGLVEQLGGPPTAGIGWAGGIERLMLLAGDPPPAARPLAIIPVGEGADVMALKLAQELRHAGRHIDLAFRGNVGKRMKRANKINASHALFVAADKPGRIEIKDLDSGAQNEVDRAALSQHLPVA